MVFRRAGSMLRGLGPWSETPTLGTLTIPLRRGRRAAGPTIACAVLAVALYGCAQIAGPTSETRTADLPIVIPPSGWRCPLFLVSPSPLHIPMHTLSVSSVFPINPHEGQREERARGERSEEIGKKEELRFRD